MPLAPLASGSGCGCVSSCAHRRHVDCPAIWCWGRRPVIVLPEAAKPATTVDWAGVLCHELAHWLRRDHWSSLLGELLTAALPWHPLAWWARHRLGSSASSPATTGCSAPACRPRIMPSRSWASSLSVAHLWPWRPSRAVADSSAEFSTSWMSGASSPLIGKRWACTSAVVVVLAASAMALAQSRPAVSKGHRSATRGTAENVKTSKTTAVNNQEAAKTRTITGNGHRA